MQRKCERRRKVDNFTFPVADGTVKNLWERTASENIHLNLRSVRNEGKNKKFFEENQADSFPNPLQGDSTCDDAEAKNYFWSITGDFIYRHHVEPRVKLYVPREESFSDEVTSTLPEVHTHH